MRPRLKPVLAPLQVASLALGCVIGFGCFILAGDFLETAGPLGAALGITLGGLAMLVIARSYGLMVRTFPVAGAEFAYAYRAAGRHHAEICGWFLTLGYLSIVPLNATALAILGKFLAPELFARGYLYRVGGFEVFAGEVGLAAFAVVLVGFLHSRGVRGVGRMQVVMTGLMVAAVAAVGIGGPGASLANWEPWFAPGRPAWSGVLAMLAISPWLYVGFDTLPQAAEEFAFPAGRAFRLMAAAILAGAGMYVVVLLSTGVVLPWRELLAGEPAWATGVTVRASLGTAGVTVLSVAVAMAIFTVSCSPARSRCSPPSSAGRRSFGSWTWRPSAPPAATCTPASRLSRWPEAGGRGWWRCSARSCRPGSSPSCAFPGCLASWRPLPGSPWRDGSCSARCSTSGAPGSTRRFPVLSWTG